MQLLAASNDQCDNGSRKGCGKGANKCANARPSSEYRSPNTERNTSQANSSETGTVRLERCALPAGWSGRASPSTC
eukprot:3434130-Alexandrium_andersonii.AAC.1